MKICNKCKKEKCLEEYYTTNWSTDGRCYTCIKCMKKYADDNREKIRNYHKENYQKRKEEYKKSSADYYNKVKDTSEYKQRMCAYIIKRKQSQKTNIPFSPGQPKILEFCDYTDHAVYLIRNNINDKSYVGITQDTILNRFKSHKKAPTPLGSAIRKYGPGNFTICILECNLDQNQAAEKEVYYIKELKTNENGYNQTDGGEKSSSYKMNESTRQKLSDSNSFRTYKVWNDQEIHTIQSLKKFCKERNLTMSLMSMVLSGNRKHHKGWKISIIYTE